MALILLVLIFIAPMNADAQLFKWFKKKKKKKKENVEVVQTVEVVSVNKDTVAIVNFIMPKTVKNENSGPYGEFTNIFVNDKVVNVNGVEFVMKCVQGGTFTMGGTLEQGFAPYEDEFPLHKVAVSSFYMAEQEVTQDLWKNVMGTEPSKVKGLFNPVENVSWNDCVEFIHKLNNITGLNFRLPTEAEWEFAARGGVFSLDFPYSGGYDPSHVAWTSENATEPASIGEKYCNQLGIYDLSGNISEWCYDWYGPYTEEIETNPLGPAEGELKVIRGGDFENTAREARVSARMKLQPFYASSNIGLRLVADITEKDIHDTAINPHHGMFAFKDYDTQYLPNEKFNVNGVEFTMVGVQGGTYLMGATIEQTMADPIEDPCHSVAISSFKIGQTEVTQALWNAVMGGKCPAQFKNPNQPVESVTWNDVQTFIMALNKITGKTFRLPTEAEWEYAARGGNLSKRFIYPGSDDALKVSWSAHNCKGGPKAVGLLQPNELGIYDMGGNVAEWCADWFGFYTDEPVTNPVGASIGRNKILRGHHWEDGMQYCRPDYRYSKSPTYKSYYVGFRLAL